jgi:hypothetical protein
MVSAEDPIGRNLGFLDRTSLEHSHKALPGVRNYVSAILCHRQERLPPRSPISLVFFLFLFLLLRALQSVMYLGLFCESSPLVPIL